VVPGARRISPEIGETGRVSGAEEVCEQGALDPAAAEDGEVECVCSPCRMLGVYPFFREGGGEGGEGGGELSLRRGMPHWFVAHLGLAWVPVQFVCCNGALCIALSTCPKAPLFPSIHPSLVSNHPREHRGAYT